VKEDLEKCQAGKKPCGDDKEQCETARSGCCEVKETSLDELYQERASCAGSEKELEAWKSGTTMCPGQHGKTVSNGGKSYKLHCNRKSSTPLLGLNWHVKGL
jgi:hypothetical protein